jgi:hypothetical protein
MTRQRLKPTWSWRGGVSRKRAVESNETQAVRTRGPGRVVLGSKPQLATAKKLVIWAPKLATAKKNSFRVGDRVGDNEGGEGTEPYAGIE